MYQVVLDVPYPIWRFLWLIFLSLLSFLSSLCLRVQWCLIGCEWPWCWTGLICFRLLIAWTIVSFHAAWTGRHSGVWHCLCSSSDSGLSGWISGGVAGSCSRGACASFTARSMRLGLGLSRQRLVSDRPAGGYQRLNCHCFERWRSYACSLNG